MCEANPELTPAQVRTCLTGTAVDMVAPADTDPESEVAKLTPGDDVASGWGMVDARRAVECAHAMTLEPAGEDASPAPDGSDVSDGDETPAAPLPVTGGGFALLGLAAVGVARGAHRRAG